ncbi:MAG: hypothetical protein AAF456_02685 [Planctomycetota bacterium]
MSTGSKQNRLSIMHLMMWTAGIALAITIAGGIKWLRTTAAYQYSQWPYQTEMDTFDYMAAVVYGTSVVLFLFAVRSPDFWSSPGKIVMMIMALMCVLDWVLTIAASEWVLHQSSFSQYPLPGIYFANLAPAVGYTLSIPLTIFILCLARTPGLRWRITWFCFLLFGTMMFLLIWVPDRTVYKLPHPVRNWYFECAIGLPMVAMFIAFSIDLIRRSKVDWWTTVACTLLPSIWLLHVSLTAVSRI